jgi:hypothetical protein
MIPNRAPELTPEEEDALEAFMQRLAQKPLQVREIAPAHVLWWKAQLLRRWQAERQVTLPLDVSEPLQVAYALATAAVALLWVLPSVVATNALPGLDLDRLLGLAVAALRQFSAW